MKNLLLVILVAFSCFASAQKSTHLIYFKKNQIHLSPEQEKQLRTIAAKSKEEELMTILPLTYDSIFEHYIFAKIADKQAAAIASYAITIGYRLISTPSNFPSSYKGRSYSVNLKFFKKIIVEEKSAFFAPKPSQFFLIDPKRDTLINGKEGTKLHFPIGCLQTKSKVMVELKEYYSMADYLKSGLATTSNGKMIESGGVIYLNAVENNASKKQVKINPDKGIGAEFTLGKKKPGMQIFIKDPSTSRVNWISQDSFGYKEVWQMTETIYDDQDNIISQITYKSKAEWEQHLKEEEAARIALEKKQDAERKELEKKQEADRKEAEKRQKLQMQAQQNKGKSDKMLQIYNLGFINCDRFMDEPQKSFVVNLNDSKVANIANYYLVFKDIRGVMNGYASNNVLSFGNVPVNRQATLIAISFEGKQGYYYSSPLVTGSQAKVQIDLKPVDEKFMDTELAKLK